MKSPKKKPGIPSAKNTRAIHGIATSYTGDRKKGKLTSKGKPTTLQSVKKELEGRKAEKALFEKQALQKTRKLEKLNRQLFSQNQEKEKRAAELVIANKELAFQNKEKESRAAELVIANKELAFQNSEKEKRAKELLIANKELQVFTYISSHDLKEPLRKIQMFAALLLKTEATQLSARGRDYLVRSQSAARQMHKLIEALHVYAHISLKEQPFKKTSLAPIVQEVKEELSDKIIEKKALISAETLCRAYINPDQFKQVIWHLMDNALTFSRAGVIPRIIIQGRIAKGSTLHKENPALEKRQLAASKDYCHISFTDNGIGFEPKYSEKIFEVFQRLHGKEVYKGTGIGLSIVKKIIQYHNGCITATGSPGNGARFDIYILTK